MAISLSTLEAPEYPALVVRDSAPMQLQLHQNAIKC